MISFQRISLIPQKETTNTIIDQIVSLKNQHWLYSRAEHLKWLKNNIGLEDFHLLIYAEDSLIAYLNMVHRQIYIEDKTFPILGIGNVCVHRQYQNYKIGIFLMNTCRFYLSSLKMEGMLLCKDELKEFYIKTGWVNYLGKKKCNNEELLVNLFFTKKSNYLLYPEININAFF